MVRDAQVVSVFMHSGQDVEVCPPSIHLSFIPSRPPSQQDNLPCPGFYAGTIPEKTSVFQKQHPLSKILAADGGEDDIRIDDFFLHLRPQGQGVGHKVVHQAWAALGVAVNGGKGGLLYNGRGASRTGDLMKYVLRHLRIREPGKVVMYGDSLTQGLWTGFLRVLFRCGSPQCMRVKRFKESYP